MAIIEGITLPAPICIWQKTMNSFSSAREARVSSWYEELCHRRDQPIFTFSWFFYCPRLALFLWALLGSRIAVVARQWTASGVPLPPSALRRSGQLPTWVVWLCWPATCSLLLAPAGAGGSHACALHIISKRSSRGSKAGWPVVPSWPLSARGFMLGEVPVQGGRLIGCCLGVSGGASCVCRSALDWLGLHVASLVALAIGIICYGLWLGYWGYP